MATTEDISETAYVMERAYRNNKLMADAIKDAQEESAISYVILRAMWLAIDAYVKIANLSKLLKRD